MNFSGSQKGDHADDWQQLSPRRDRRHGGVNFSLFSRDATGVELLFFDRPEDAKPARVISLDPVTNRTYHYWHVFVPDCRPGQIYGYRAQGPFDPARGCDLMPAKVLLDPYGRGVVVPKALQS